MATLIQEVETPMVETERSIPEQAATGPVKHQKVTTGKSTKIVKRMALAGGLAVALATAGVAAYTYYQDRVTTDDAQVDAHIAPIASKVFGNVAEILVKDNETVKAGQVLVRLDARDYEAHVAQARAALAAAESQATGARVGVPLVNATTASGADAAEAQLAAARADYERVKADYDRASTSELATVRADIESSRATAERTKADRIRMEPLAAQDEISKQQFDAYIAAARVADSDLNASQQRLASAEKEAQGVKSAMAAAAARVTGAQAGVKQAKANREQVNISSAQAGSASAAVLQARANLDTAQLQLSYATIVAPVNGVVTRKSVQDGQIVQPGQGLMTIVPVNDAYVIANFKETQLASVRPGQRAEVYIDMYGKTFEAVVDSLSNATGTRLSLLPPENATGNYVKIVQRIPVKLVVKNLPSGLTLRPGMNAEATVFTK